MSDNEKSKFMFYCGVIMICCGILCYILKSSFWLCILLIFLGLFEIACSNHLKKQYKEKETREKELAKIEEDRAMRAAEWARITEEKQRAFESAVDKIPRVPIDKTGKKGTLRDQNEIQDIKYNTITAKTNAFNLEDFVVIDLETTGTKKRDAIVSVSAVAFEGGEPARVFYTLINPERQIPAEASAVNGIFDADVAEAPTTWQIMPGLQGFVGSLPIVGHNLPFDLGYLYRYGFELGTNKRFDTLSLSRRAIPKKYIESYKLADCCRYYGIRVFNSHNALYDSYVTGLLFNKIVETICSNSEV